MLHRIRSLNNRAGNPLWHSQPMLTCRLALGVSRRCPRRHQLALQRFHLHIHMPRGAAAHGFPLRAGGSAGRYLRRAGVRHRSIRFLSASHSSAMLGTTAVVQPVLCP